MRPRRDTSRLVLPLSVAAAGAIALVAVSLSPSQHTEAAFVDNAAAAFAVTTAEAGGGEILALPTHQVVLTPEGKVLKFGTPEQFGTDTVNTSLLGEFMSDGEEFVRCGDDASLTIDDIDGYVYAETIPRAGAFAYAVDGATYEMETTGDCLLPTSSPMTIVAGAKMRVGASQSNGSTTNSYNKTSLSFGPYVGASGVTGFEVHKLELRSGAVYSESTTTLPSSTVLETTSSAAKAYPTAMRARVVMASGEMGAWSTTFMTGTSSYGNQDANLNALKQHLGTDDVYLVLL